MFTVSMLNLKIGRLILWLMKKIIRILSIAILSCGVWILAGCQLEGNTPVVSETTATPVSSPATGDMNDPFSYCASIGTIDQPDARYTGEVKPDSVIQGLMAASGASADTPVDVFSQGSIWRCMDGKVIGCFVGANLPCESKANTNTEPTSEMNTFCEEDATAEYIPAAVTGHDTIYEWKCQDGKAVIGDQVFHVDSQGYISEIWYAIEP